MKLRAKLPLVLGGSAAVASAALLVWSIGTAYACGYYDFSHLGLTWEFLGCGE